MYDKGCWITLSIFLIIGMTFGVWKIIEIILWIFKHVSIVLH